MSNHKIAREDVKALAAIAEDSPQAAQHVLADIKAAKTPKAAKAVGIRRRLPQLGQDGNSSKYVCHCAGPTARPGVQSLPILDPPPRFVWPGQASL